jgi:anti-sigma factor RsiW
MTHTDTDQLMHAVLDGQATPSESLAFERHLAANPALRAEFDELRHICDALDNVPGKFPPEGLVAAVMARLPEHSAPVEGMRQLFGPSRVIGEDSMNAPGTRPGKSATGRGMSQPGPHYRGENMSEQKSGSNRKILIGAGIAAAAVIVAFSTGMFPPSATNTSGTIVPAQRYRADQPAVDNVVGGAPGVQSGVLNSAATDAATNNATQNATNKSLENSTNKSLENSTNKSLENSTNKSLENSTNKSLENSTNKSLENSTNNSLNNATNKSLENSTNKSLNNATNKSLENSTNKSLENATNKSLDNATNKSLN